MEKPSCKSEFSSAYKMTTCIIDKKGLRVRRRSMEQKQMRRELTNKNRNIDNLSPLQEEDVSVNKSYKEKTPMKRDEKTGQDGQKIDNRKMQMLKWKEERMKAKKLEVAKKKPIFKISGSLEREDFTLFSKSKNSKNASKPSEKTSVFMPAMAVQEKKKVNGIRPLEKSNVFMPVIAVQEKNRGNETKPLEKTKVLMPVTTIWEKKKIDEIKDAMSKTTRNQGSGMMPPPNKAHPTRASTRSSNKPIATITSSASRGKEKETYPSRTTRQSAAKKVKENERPTPVQDTVKSTPEVCEDKVTTTRGGGEISFAPEDFAFTAPSSITSYIFQPLSPASAAQFLYPTQDTSVSFYDSAPGRCSTPKSAGIDASKKTLDKPVKDEREEDKNKSNGDGAILETGETLKVESNEREEVERQTKPRRSLRKSKAEICMQLEKISSGRVTRSMRFTSVEETTNSGSDLCEQNHPNKELDKQNRRVSYSSKKFGCIEAEEINKMDLMEECETVTDKTPGKKTSDSEEKMETETINISHKKEPVSETEERDCVATDMIDDLPSVSSLESVEEGSQVTKQEHKSTPLKNETLQSQKRVTRRSVAVMEAEFACPTETSILRSAKKSSQKRRKTHLEKMSKSPEEWVELLRQSPMVEMTRRTPRRKSNADSNVIVPPLNFDDIDLDESLTITVEVPESSSDGMTVITTAQSLEPIECVYVPTQSMEPESTVTSTNVDTQNSQIEDSLGIPTGPSEVMVHDSFPKREEPACEQVQDPDVSSSSTTKPELDRAHDVKYFRSLLVHHTERLTQLCDQWTEPMDSTHGLDEDVKGQIRTVVGQAQLLMCQRFKQFTGLVDNCEFGLGEKETTCMDLQGFWDMIYFQVEDVDNKFEELSTLQKNNWVLKSDKPAEKVPRKKPAQVSNPKPKTNVKSKFAAFRAQIKKQTQSGGLTSPVATIPSSDTGINVFDAGFFRVISPVRSPKPHCEAGTPKSKSSEKDPQSLGYLTPAPLRQTPLRKSYLPAVPSPLLQDTTPRRQSKRRSSIRKATKQKYILAYAEMQSESSNSDEENRPLTDCNSVSDSVKYVSTLSSEEAGTSHKESGMLKSTTPSAAFPTKSRRSNRKSSPAMIFTEPVADKENSSTPIAAIENRESGQSVSRSMRTRRSVIFMDDTSKQDQENNLVACDLESGSDLFLKYLQPTKCSKVEQNMNDSFSKYLKPSNIVDTSLPFSSPEVEKSSVKRKISPSQETSSAKKSRLSCVHKSSLKTTPSSTKLRTRRSVRFSASADEEDTSSFKLPTTPYLTHRSGVSKDGDICNVVDETAPRRSTRRSVSQQKQQMEDGLGGTTLVMKSARPSLLYDPEEMRASTRSFVSGDLIVFTP